MVCFEGGINRKYIYVVLMGGIGYKVKSKKTTSDEVDFLSVPLTDKTSNQIRNYFYRIYPVKRLVFAIGGKDI
jgi:hypothetical protein